MNDTIKTIIQNSQSKRVSLDSMMDDVNNQIADLQATLDSYLQEYAELTEVIEKLGGSTDEKPKHRVQWFNTDNLMDKYPASVVVHGEGCSHIKISQQDPIISSGLESVSDVEEWESPEDFAGDYNADFHAEGGREACWSIAFFPCTGMVERLTITTGYDED